MKTAEEFSRQIRAILKLIDPDISAEPLTVERKMIDSVADVLAQATVDQYVLDYQYDIDTKVGTDLDALLGMFGYGRHAARKAQGYVSFARSTPALTDIVILPGTHVQKPATSISREVTFYTTEAVVIPTGTYTAVAPIEASVPGALGNVPANSIISVISGTADISSVTNDAATSNGEDEETDVEFRTRFKNTVLRNLAGTVDQYLALAVASKFASKAKVIGPIDRYSEILQIVSSAATSGIPYSKYTYAFDYYLSDGDTLNEEFYSPNSVDYTFNDNIPPDISVVNTTTLPEAAIVRLEHSYCSENSRNDPVNNIANYVDIYVAGEANIIATESMAFPGSGNNFVNNTASVYHVGYYQRRDGSSPVVGNRYQQLLWQPVTLLPTTINIGSSTYVENTHYWWVKDLTIYKGSKRARCGIEWLGSVAGAISTGTQFTMSYTFNRLPLILNELMDSHRQVTADVLVHSANERYFNVNLVAMYSTGFAKESVDIQVETVLTEFFNKQTFGAIIQISDIVDTVHGVNGIDNVRLAQPSDGVSPGIVEVAANGITPVSGVLLNDFYLDDIDLPVLNSVTLTQKSQNTW